MQHPTATDAWHTTANALNNRSMTIPVRDKKINNHMSDMEDDEHNLHLQDERFRTSGENEGDSRHVADVVTVEHDDAQYMRLVDEVHDESGHHSENMSAAAKSQSGRQRVNVLSSEQTRNLPRVVVSSALISSDYEHLELDRVTSTYERLDSIHVEDGDKMALVNASWRYLTVDNYYDEISDKWKSEMCRHEYDEIPDKNGGEDVEAGKSKMSPACESVAGNKKPNIDIVPNKVNHCTTIQTNQLENIDSMLR